MNNQINIQKDNVLNAYKNASNEQKELLENLLGKDIFKPKDIRERVKTFEDACEVLGNDNQAVADYYAILDAVGSEDILAFAQLRVIAEALNEGWKPVFDGESCRYYPWVYIYSKTGYEELSDEETAECRVVGRASYYAYASGGRVYSSAVSVSASSSASYGSRLAFKSEELAKYAGKQFIDIWEKFLFV